jgi:hypothetical protein
MGEDYYSCCVCGDTTSDYNCVGSCDGCDESFCSEHCKEQAIQPSEDGEICCLDCCCNGWVHIKDWLKQEHLGLGPNPNLKKHFNASKAQLLLQNEI